MLASVAAYYSEISFVLILGVLLQIMAYLVSPTKQMSNNVLPLIGWFILIGINKTPSKNLINAFELHSSFYEVYKYIVSLVTLIFFLQNNFKYNFS